MPNTIAGYFIDELADWNNNIVFYNNEMEEFTQKLNDVIRRNSIPGISAKVEWHQARLNEVSEKFYNIQKTIHQQELTLKTDSTLVDNTAISNETEKKQAELRRIMQEIEKEYIDRKFDCYTFFSDTFRK